MIQRQRLGFAMRREVLLECADVAGEVIGGDVDLFLATRHDHALTQVRAQEVQGAPQRGPGGLAGGLGPEE